jgi:hypothetical protein
MSQLSLSSVILAMLLALACAPAARGQDCAPPPITANTNNYNIFSPEQEMIIGELTLQELSGELRFIHDPQLTAYLTRIGEKLIQHLPPTGLKFKFFIVDLPRANAFNIPGGYVFVSRKLIGFTNNEDELAGVVAHELGHATVRHGARDLSEYFKKILNVTQVGDRKDVAQKYHLFLEKQRTKRVFRGEGHMNEKQLEADRIGLFAMVAAGYDPLAHAEFFGRLTDNKVGGGSWFSDIFGGSNPEEKRIREMIKATETMPKACRENRQATATDDFLKWQANVVSSRDLNRKEELPSLLWKRALAPPLRSDVSHFAFSQDGKHFLAQDDFGIAVVQREPLKVLFQIPTTAKTEAASFTPDGQFVVYGTEDLRLEKWSIAEQKPVLIRELVVPQGCGQHGFSPDGNYLVCIGYDLTLSVLETQTGKKVWEKKEFYQLNVFEVWLLSMAQVVTGAPPEENFFRIGFSPDARTLLVTRSGSFRVSGSGTVSSHDTALAMDLTTLKPLSLGGDLKGLTSNAFALLDSNKIVAMSRHNVDQGGVFTFPEGKRLGKFPVFGRQLEATANPDYVIVKPTTKSRMGMIYLPQLTLAAGMDKLAAAIWQNLMIYESVSGTILVASIHYEEKDKQLKIDSTNTLELPVGKIGNLSATEVSDNFQWLAISSKTRGALWDLASGQRKVFVRGFVSSLLTNKGTAVSEFPKQDPQTHTLAIIQPQTDDTQVMLELPERGARQYRQFILLQVSLKPAKENSPREVPTGDPEPGEPLNRAVRFELRAIPDNKLVWSREFPKAAPRFFFDDYSGRMILYWTLGSEAGKERLKQDPALAARSSEMGNKDDDYLVEVIDGFAGKTVGTLLLETGKGSFNIESGLSEGDWLVLHDSNNRVLAYSIKSGELRHRFFGASAAINPIRNQIAVENYPGELTLYDLGDGESMGRLVFGSDAAFLRFSLDGKRLFVLTADQAAYAFAMTGPPGKSAER